MFAQLMGLKTISPDDLHQLMQRERVTAIDVNSRQSWANAHVPGAKHLDPLAYHRARPAGRPGSAAHFLLLQHVLPEGTECRAPGKGDGLSQRARHVVRHQRLARCRSTDGIGVVLKLAACSPSAYATASSGESARPAVQHDSNLWCPRADRARPIARS